MFGNSIVDPSITATADRTGVLTGSVVGTGYHLSPFFATVSLTEGTANPSTALQLPHGRAHAVCLRTLCSTWPVQARPHGCLLRVTCFGTGGWLLSYTCLCAM